MADDTGTTAVADPTGDIVSAVDADDATLGDAGKKALVEERKNARLAAKERDALAARLKEYEDRDKSEQQKLEERATAAEKRAAETETRALRLEVAAEKGLSPSQAKRLIGATKDELEKDADEMLAEFNPARPRGDAGQGPRETAKTRDMNDFIRGRIRG